MQGAGKLSLIGISPTLWLETKEKTALDIANWYQKHQLQHKDNLLTTILDWETGHFLLKPDPDRQYKKHLAEIREGIRLLLIRCKQSWKRSATNLFRMRSLSKAIQSFYRWS